MRDATTEPLRQESLIATRNVKKPIDDAIRPKAFFKRKLLSIQSRELISQINTPKTQLVGHERDTVDGPSPPSKRWLTVKNEQHLTRVGGVHAVDTEVIYAVLFNAEVGHQSSASCARRQLAAVYYSRVHLCELR